MAKSDGSKLTGGGSAEEVDGRRVSVLQITIGHDCAACAGLVACLLHLRLVEVWCFWDGCAGDRTGEMRRGTGGSMGVRIGAIGGRTCHVVHLSGVWRVYEAGILLCEEWEKERSTWWRKATFYTARLGKDQEGGSSDWQFLALFRWCWVNAASS